MCRSRSCRTGTPLLPEARPTTRRPVFRLVCVTVGSPWELFDDVCRRTEPLLAVQRAAGGYAEIRSVLPNVPDPSIPSLYSGRSRRQGEYRRHPVAARSPHQCGVAVSWMSTHCCCRWFRSHIQHRDDTCDSFWYGQRRQSGQDRRVRPGTGPDEGHATSLSTPDLLDLRDPIT